MPKAAALLFYTFLILSGQYENNAKSLNLTFTGDLMAHTVNFNMKDYTSIYRELEPLLQADDLTFGNLEIPVVPDLPQTGYPRFNVHPPYVAAAVAAGLDVFSLANNHSYDQGLRGVLGTLNSLQEIQAETGKPLYYSGIKASPLEDFEPVMIRHKAWKIGFIAVTQFMNLPFDKHYVFKCDYNNPEEAAELLDWIKKRAPAYDLFIVSYHGDVEYARQPAAAKTAFFYRLLDAGTHIVYGHHPHVLQPYELVTHNGVNKAILYSTGNFIAGQGYIIKPDLPPDDEWAYTGDSAIFILQLKLTAQGASVTRIIPFLIGNYTTDARGVIIKPLKDMAATPLRGKAWQDFYHARLKIMQDFLRENKSTALKPDKPDFIR
jgi:poly-gamma-glutamate synthesis protein (capsule biosynthesis protein)